MFENSTIVNWESLFSKISVYFSLIFVVPFIVVFSLFPTEFFYLFFFFGDEGVEGHSYFRFMNISRITLTVTAFQRHLYLCVSLTHSVHQSGNHWRRSHSVGVSLLIRISSEYVALTMMLLLSGLFTLCHALCSFDWMKTQRQFFPHCVVMGGEMLGFSWVGSLLLYMLSQRGNTSGLHVPLRCPTMKILSLFCGTQWFLLLSTCHWQSYPSSSIVAMMVLKVFPLSWLSNPLTFSKTNNRGCFARSIRASSKKSVPLVSSKPLRFQAIEKAWQGNPQTRQSKSGRVAVSIFVMSP